LVYFCVLALVPRGDYTQLAKINDLLKHYQTHKIEAATQNKSITFINFLYVHFIDIEEHDDHEDHHEKLPFKNISISNLLYFEPLLLLGLNQSNLYKFVFISFINQLLPDGFLNSIFRPPTYFI